MICQLFNSGEEPAPLSPSETLGVLEASSSAPRGWLCLISSRAGVLYAAPRKSSQRRKGVFIFIIPEEELPEQHRDIL